MSSVVDFLGGGMRVLAVPDLAAPRLVVPLDHRAAAAYALRTWLAGETWPARARNAALAALAGRGRLPGRLATGVLPGPAAPPPMLAAAALAFPGVVDAGSGWFLTVPGGDDLTRPVLHLVPPGGDRPSHALKFSRVRGRTEPFEADERGLRLVEAAGVDRAVPRFVGRFDHDGYPASMETAAPGAPLDRLLRRGGRAAEATVDAIAAWVVELGQGTTLCHNDLGSWNIHAAGPGDFTVLDWESATDGRRPLADLLYFLADALALLAGARTIDERVTTAVEIFAGRHRFSGWAFDWIERGAAAPGGLDDDAIAAAAIDVWCRHEQSHARRVAMATAAATDPPPRHPAERMAEAWLSDPALGPTWPARRQRARP